jgi:hypothetical protein
MWLAGSVPGTPLHNTKALPSYFGGEILSWRYGKRDDGQSFFGSKQRATAKDANGKAAIISTLGVLAL